MAVSIPGEGRRWMVTLDNEGPRDEMTLDSGDASEAPLAVAFVVCDEIASGSLLRATKHSGPVRRAASRSKAVAACSSGIHTIARNKTRM